ncbi:MAG: hypothetical protein PHP70_02010 [Gallionella sp.]|nr:hypothetical protein [Gallionella sp.]
MSIVELKNVRSPALHSDGVGGRSFSTVTLHSVARKTALYKIFWLVCAELLFVLCSLPCQAYEEDLAADPPQVRALLNQAAALKLSGEIRRAATLYCKASRLGSLEAQYRLGMLYLSGKGMLKNLAFAYSLFSQAAQQGHARAQDMLETISIRTSVLPPCMV